MERINKTQARKMFNEGQEIIVTPCKIMPNSLFAIQAEIQKDKLSDNRFNQSYGVIGFDNYINHFEYYNCNYKSGYYCSYYVEVEINK